MGFSWYWKGFLDRKGHQHSFCRNCEFRKPLGIYQENHEKNVRYTSKLDRVGLVDNRPSTNKLHQFVKKMTCDMWHVTRDMWHATCDRWHVVGGEHSLKFQLPRSSSLWFMIFWRVGGKDSLSDWMSDKADCRTAPATPGLLIIS